jgi:hypothetical protein
MYDWVQDEIRKELAKISIEPPDYVEPPTSDYHNGWEEGFEAAKNLFKKESAPQELAHSKQEFYPDWDTLRPFHERIAELEKELAKPEQEPVRWFLQFGDTPLKPWVGLTNEDWENTPDTGKQGCERDAELFDWIEKTLKDKNDTL